MIGRLEGREGRRERAIRRERATRWERATRRDRTSRGAVWLDGRGQVVGTGRLERAKKGECD